MSGTTTTTLQSAGDTKLDAVKQAEPKKLTGIDLYSRFAFACAVCCSVTHGGLTPVDV
jgi:solute carrier family 25 phosphate transporter 3